MYIYELNMSSSSSESEQSSNSVRQGLLTDSGDEDVSVVNLVVNPCESEPLKRTEFGVGRKRSL